MNRPCAVLLASALLLTGCSTGSSESAGSTGTSPSTKVSVEPDASTEPVVETETPQNTCRALFNADEGSLHETSTSWLINVDSLDKETAAEAEEFSAKLGAVAATAEPELADPIERMRAPFDDFVEAWDVNGSWTPDVNAKEAMQETIDICEGYFPARTEAAAPTQPAISDDFNADAVKAGLVTEDIELWKEVVVPGICVPGEAFPQLQLDSSVGISREGGKYDEVLRLVVQHFCPDRSDIFEESLARVKLEEITGG